MAWPVVDARYTMMADLMDPVAARAAADILLNLLNHLTFSTHCNVYEAIGFQVVHV